MPDIMKITRRIRTIVVVGSVVAVAALAVTALAPAATPIVSVGPAGSPTGGTATGTVSSSGQSDACLDQQHSGVNPSASSSTGAVQIADSSCAATSSSPTTTSGAPSSASGSQGGGAQSESGTQTTTSQTTTHGSTSTVVRRSAGLSVAKSKRTVASVGAANAHGVLITHVRYKLLRAKAGRHLRILVTVRDRQRRAVRFAAVSLGKLAGAKHTLPGVRLGFSNRKGQAAFVVPLTKSVLGRRFLIRIAARTPTAHALTFGSVAVPKQRPHRTDLRR
jgi:hypothetical protein